jgi:hypothetical protein
MDPKPMSSTKKSLEIPKSSDTITVHYNNYSYLWHEKINYNYANHYLKFAD